MDRRFLRPGWVAGHLLVFAAVLTCLRLGWWQWERTQETTGTAQNFGYALLWPGFAVAFVYMWVRFLHLEVLKDAEEDEDTDRELRELLDREGTSPTAEEQDLIAAVDPASTGTRTPQTRTAQTRTPAADPPEAGDPATEDPDTPRVPRRRPDLQRPSQGVVISIATVGDVDDDDPELTAYNQALAALAEEDRRRAR